MFYSCQFFAVVWPSPEVVKLQNRDKFTSLVDFEGLQFEMDQSRCSIQISSHFITLGTGLLLDFILCGCVHCYIQKYKIIIMDMVLFAEKFISRKSHSVVMQLQDRDLLNFRKVSLCRWVNVVKNVFLSLLPQQVKPYLM